MLGAANVGAETFDLLLDHSRYDYDLFAPPNPALATVDHAIGLHASALVRDAGTLQIGIGELGDSIVYSLLLRHQRTTPGGARCADAGTERSAALVDADRRARAVHHRPVRRHRDVRRPDARPVPRRHPAPPRLRLSTVAARAGRERLEHARRRGAARRTASRRRRGPRTCSARTTSRRCATPASCAARRASTTAPSSRPTACASTRTWRTRRRARRWRANAWASSCRAARSCTRASCSGPRAFYAALRALPESERRLFDMRGVGYINQLYGDDFELESRSAATRAS